MKLDNKYLSRIEIKLTTQCNAKCPLCIEAGSVNGLPHDMNEGLLRKILGEIVHRAQVVFLGGEPLLYFLNKQYLYDDIFSNDNIIPTFMTNGSLLSQQENLLYYLSRGQWQIVLSAEGINENYNYLRRPNSWNVFLDNLVLIQEKRKKNYNFTSLAINYIISKTSIEDLSEFIATTEGYGVSCYNILHLMPSPTAEREYGIDFNEHIVTDLSYYKNKLLEAKKLLEDRNSTAMFSCKPIGGEVIYDANHVNDRELWGIDRFAHEDRFCEKPYRMFIINWNGNVSPCCGGPNLVLGNCNNDSIYDIYNNQYFDRLRDDVVLSKPEYCECSQLHADSNLKNADYLCNNHEGLRGKYLADIEKYNAILTEDVDEAIQYLEDINVYDFNIHSILIWNQLAGVYLYRKENFEKAAFYLDKILCLDPNNIAALIKKANVCIYTHNYQSAIDQFSAIGDSEAQKNPLVYFWTGYAYEKMELLDNALSNYRLFVENEIDDNSWGYKHASEVINVNTHK